MIDTQQPFKIANITIYPKTDEMSCEGVTIEIKSMTMKLICFFAQHPDEVITRDTLRANLWQNSNASDHTINNHIYSLRQVFATFDEQTKFFHTVTGSESGYRLLVEVTQEIVESNEEKKQPLSAALFSSFLSEKPNAEEQGIHNSSSKSQFIYLCSLLTIILCTVIFLIYSTPSYDNISPLTSMSGREQNPSISQDGKILLFANRTNRESSWELYASRLSTSSTILETKKVFSNDSRNENYVSISPNKKHIAFIRYPQHERGIYLADFDEDTLTATNDRLIIPLKNMNLSPVISWLNDTQFFYNATEAISAPRKIFQYDITTNTSETISAPPINTYGDFAAVVAPNKKWLAIMRSDELYGYQLFLYDLDKKILTSTPISNNKERLYVSFSDDSEAIYFVDQQGFLSSYLINEQQVEIISSLLYPGYWPLKVPGRDQFIFQQDWGLSSLTNRVMRINNPLTGGDGKREAIVDNGLHIRSIAGIANDGLIFASITSNQQVELWKYQEGQSIKLDAFNNAPQHHTFLSLNWLKGSDKAVLSINNTCHLIDINTGKDSPLCPANETLYAGNFSKDGQSIYLAGDINNTPKSMQMGVSGYPLTTLSSISAANSIHEGESGDFYYSKEPNFDIYHYNSATGENTKLIERTFVIERFSNNDFALTQSGIYFMDRKKIRENAIYFYDFNSKEVSFVTASKDNYPHVVVSEDERFIYLIESYDNNSHLSLVQ